MPTWTIKGETGKGLDATVRTLPSLGIEAATLEFAALSPDRLTFTMLTSTAAGAGIDGVNRIPTLGQQVELFRDGVRKFVGHAVAPEVGLDRVTVTVRGPWEWLSTVPVSQVKAGTRDVGATGERPSYVFPEQGLRESLRVLNNAARDAGVPVKAIGSGEVGDHISATFPVLKTTISSKSWADALADLMAWCVDGVPWFDHGGTGYAQFKMTRRGIMTPLTLTVGSQMTECKIRPRLDLEVKRVELHYVTRNPTTGLPRWARQGHGPAEPGKLQMVPVSGPDVAVLVPPDDFDSVTLKTKAANLTTVDAFEYDPVLKEAARQWGKFLGSAATISNPGWHIIASGETAEWMRADYGLQTKDLRIQRWVNGTYIGSTGLGACANYLKSIGRLSWKQGGTGTPTFSLYLDYTVPVINLSYPAKVTVYKKWDYDFLSPPASLAENLRDTQNWVPWEGSITEVSDDVSGDNLLNRKIRLAGSLAVCATMDALLKRVTYDIPGGRTTYLLGAPARTDFGSMIKRIQRQPADNIAYL